MQLWQNGSVYMQTACMCECVVKYAYNCSLILNLVELHDELQTSLSEQKREWKKVLN